MGFGAVVLAPMRYQTLLLTVVLALTATVSAAPAEDALRQGRDYLSHDKLEEAAKALEQAVELAPASAEAHHLLGAAYGIQAANGSWFTQMRLAGRVKTHFERAVALAPDEFEYRESLIQFYAFAPAIAGGGIDKARAQAVEIAKRDAVQGELAHGLIARLEDKPDDALRHYRAAYVQRPNDARLGVQLGILLQEQQHYDEAFTHFQAMTVRDAGAMGAWYQLGRTTVLAKQHLDEGELAFKRYLGHQPGPQEPPLAAAHWRLGMLYELMQRVADARGQYQAALALDPSHADAKRALGKLR